MKKQYNKKSNFTEMCRFSHYSTEQIEGAFDIMKYRKIGIFMVLL